MSTSLIAPDQRRPPDFVAFVEQDRAVDLARESDAFDLIGVDAGFSNRRPDRRGRRTPPIVRVLFGPSGLQRNKWLVFDSGGSDDSLPAASISAAREPPVPTSIPIRCIVL